MRTVIGLEQFAEHCKVESDGQTLCASCVVLDPETGELRKFTKQVDLRPAMDFVAKRLAEWHRAQHDQGVEAHGWFDDVTSYAKKAVSVVTDVAHNKTVQALYNKAAPYLDKAVRATPYGAAAMAAYDIYDQATKGSPQATQKVQQLVNISKDQSHSEQPKAKLIVNVMRQFSAMTKAKQAGLPAASATPPAPWEPAAIAARKGGGHSFYREGLTRVVGEDDDPWHGQYEIVGWGWDDINPITATKRAFNAALHPIDTLKQSYRAVTHPLDTLQHGFYGAPKRTYQSHANPYASVARRGAVTRQPFHARLPPPPPPPQDDDYDDGSDDGGDYDDAVQGRFYGHPYRTTADRMVEMKDHPGFALSAREMYNRGLGRPKTELSDLITEAVKRF